MLDCARSGSDFTILPDETGVGTGTWASANQPAFIGKLIVGDVAKPPTLFPQGAAEAGAFSKARALIKELDSDVGVVICTELVAFGKCCSKLFPVFPPATAAGC